MRIVILITAVFLAGCTQVRHFDSAQGCDVWDVVKEPIKGLVNVAPELQSRLRFLVPSKQWPDEICWYLEPSGHLVAMYRRAKTDEFNKTYEFEQRDGQWVFLKEDEYHVYRWPK
jgi:hypothetical protein